MRTLDWIIFAVIILLGIFMITYYFQEKKGECIKNPFSYGSKVLEESYGYEFSGIGYFRVPYGTKPISITFNSTGLFPQE